MLKQALPKIWNLTHNNAYGLLRYNKMEKIKAQLFEDNEKTVWLSIKFFLKQMKYTIVQGSKTLWYKSKWLKKLYREKPRFQFTGYQLSKSRRIIIDLIKFIPYSVILVVPFAQLALPPILYLYPNAVPSFYLFDTTHNKRMKFLQIQQQNAHKILLDKFQAVLRDLAKKQSSFTHYDQFKVDFFQILDELDSKLNYQNFSSDQLITVLQFMGGQFFEGTTTINKTVNLFTAIIPRWLIYKPYRYLYYKISGNPIPRYRDPWYVKQNFEVLRFNYYPFQYFKKKYLLSQINKQFIRIKEEDLAFQRYGMDDFKIYNIRYFGLQRGIAPLICYEALKNVLKNDWVKITTHPKFTNNMKLWYSVMINHFLMKSNKELSC